MAILNVMNSTLRKFYFFLRRLSLAQLSSSLERKMTANHAEDIFFPQ
jgi:hypothetical protein